jgi:hypothetical protein
MVRFPRSRSVSGNLRFLRVPVAEQGSSTDRSPGAWIATRSKHGLNCVNNESQVQYNAFGGCLQADGKYTKCIYTHSSKAAGNVPNRCIVTQSNYFLFPTQPPLHSAP